MKLLFTGYEVRKTKWSWLTIYHVQDMKTWREYTFVDKKEPDVSVMGDIFTTEGKKGLKRFTPWRGDKRGALGPVRGHTMYWYNGQVKAYLLVETEQPEGIRNVSVLVGHGKANFRTPAGMKATFRETIEDMGKQFELGMHLFIEWSRTSKAYIVADENSPYYDFVDEPLPPVVEPEPPTQQPAVGTAGSEVVSESPPG